MDGHQEKEISNGIQAMAEMTTDAEPQDESQTAQDFIATQLQLEADAREALPYQFDTCTKPLGPLRQTCFSCLTCNPPSEDPAKLYTPAGFCYSCSISCHGEHDLVELFSRRHFVCDCGTTRFPASSTCSLRPNLVTGLKGDVHSDDPAQTNSYNQNFRNVFCECHDPYDPHKEKGIMFQCMGLGPVEDGGCGEDWWHPECILGIKRQPQPAPTQPLLEGAQQNPETSDPEVDDDDLPLPEGFPDEDSFEHIICYKCTNAFPWIKQYAGTPGFLPAVPLDDPETNIASSGLTPHHLSQQDSSESKLCSSNESLKRKAGDEIDTSLLSSEPSFKKSKTDSKAQPDVPKHTTLPPALSTPISLFLTSSFRDHLCRCPQCFPKLIPHPQLLEEEETYSPPISEDGVDSVIGASNGAGSLGSRSLLDRGEAALSNIDRVRAIEGVMAYNHVRDKVKHFLKPFAESGKPVAAEDVKSYFAKLRGDDEAGAQKEREENTDFDGDDVGRKEQEGY